MTNTCSGERDMPYSDESYNLRIELDTKGCELNAGEIEKMEEDLHTLRNVVASFPVSNLYVTVVHHAKSNDYHVKTSLALSGRTLFTGDRDREAHPAFERCVRKLTKKVRAYKRQMQGDIELAKRAEGTHQDVDATGEIHIMALVEAVTDDDYGAFRRCVDVFDESLSGRVGRWIQRYPEIEAQLGETLTVSDIVEDVYLTAFELFEQRPHDTPPGKWLESLIDPSVQALLQSPEEEFARISFARSQIER
jgi:ribosome-associated translation inhibitor RaiA